MVSKNFEATSSLNKKGINKSTQTQKPQTNPKQTPKMNTQLLKYLIIISTSVKFIYGTLKIKVLNSSFLLQNKTIFFSNYFTIKWLEEKLSFIKISRIHFIYRLNHCSHNGSNTINLAAVF